MKSSKNLDQVKFQLKTARLRHLQQRDTVSSIPSSSPMNPLEVGPATPRRRNVSLPLPHYTKHESTEESGGAFRLHPARFTPIDNNPSSDSTETSIASTTPTKPTRQMVAKTTLAP